MNPIEASKKVGEAAKETARAIAEMMGTGVRVIAKPVNNGQDVKIKVIKPDGEGDTVVLNK